jgi:hypothetical protein
MTTENGWSHEIVSLGVATEPQRSKMVLRLGVALLCTAGLAPHGGEHRIRDKADLACRRQRRNLRCLPGEYVGLFHQVIRDSQKTAWRIQDLLRMNSLIM